MIGEIYALVLAVLSGVTAVLIRKVTLKSEPVIGVFITLLIAPPIYLIASLADGEIGLLSNVSITAIVYFAASGILHFLIGRTLSWHGIRLIGATRATPLLRSQILFAPALAFVFIGEQAGQGEILGVISVLVGAILVSISLGSKERKLAEKHQVLGGILTSIGAGAMWGASPILVKLAYDEINSPLIGALISSSAAAFGYLGIVWKSRSSPDFSHLGKDAMKYILAVALISPANVLLRFLALADLDVATYIVLSGLGPLFTLIFSYLFIRRLELINLRVIAATVLMLLGAYATVI
ncbi:MAG: DMT family transporter [Thaumarchaeota archaeon]|nr:DMT family transporter [Nitrososphaerota archaeon]